MKIKVSGIYMIQNKSTGLYYIGLSTDIFSRWQSHYTQLKIKKHSSQRFQDLFNKTPFTDWSFNILEVVSESVFRQTSDVPRKKLKSAYKSYLLERERHWMSMYEKSFCLNQDDKFFK